MMDIQLEDILQRENIVRQNQEDLRDFYIGKKVLVTGGGGSIGQSIILELINLGVTDYVALDRDENALHSLQLQIGGSALFDDKRIRLCDIRDLDSCLELFHTFKPDVVIHAAAHKHLSALEQQPREAFLTNVVGTRNVLDASNIVKTKIFINISTDKAAEPVSVLGMSKRVAEYLVDEMGESQIKFSVRFGNVFASKGSVIETFVFQITNNLPVTLTHLEVERYFMSNSEAAYLVLESATLEKSGLFALDMGKPIKMKLVIEKIAEKLNKKAVIEVTGLRPGEKISEVVSGSSESVSKTSLNKILSVSKNEEITFKHPTEGSLISFLRDLNLSKKVITHRTAKEFFGKIHFS